ncbi:MAG: hypothetical protein QNK36_15115 [Colwellia sp.]|nr:hypothetical protein [Colwellia sp.]
MNKEKLLEFLESNHNIATKEQERAFKEDSESNQRNYNGMKNALSYIIYRIKAGDFDE